MQLLGWLLLPAHMFKANCATRRILRSTFRLTFCTFSIFCIHFEAQHARTHTLDKKTINSQKWEIVLEISFHFFSLSCLAIMYVCCYNLITLKLNTRKIRRLVPRFPCGSMARYNFYSPVLSHWQTHSHCGRVRRSHLPERAAARPLTRSLSSLPVFSFSSARREPKVFWSRPPSRRCWPPPAPRGSLRPLKPAQATAPSWTLTPRGSGPQAAAPFAQTPRRRDMARVAPRRANAKLCTSPTRPSMTRFLLPPWTVAPSPGAAEQFFAPCADC